MMAWLQMWTIAITALSVSIAAERDWIWNSLYVEEEKPAPIPYKIGKLKSSKRVDVKSFKIEGEGGEHHLPRTKVIEVRATDADDPTTANGELKYSLIQDRAISPFEIHSTTGVISCKTNTLDRETQSRFVVVVKAQDMRGMASGSTSTTSVTISITDANDNYASFTRRIYELQVPEDHKLNEKIGTLELEDRDEIQNKEPTFTILNENSKMFNFELSPNKDGNLMLKQALDYETKSIYTFTVQVRETLRFPADNKNSAVTTAQVNIKVLDVDEAPLFSQPIYTFNVMEERTVNNIGSVKAQDPDRANKTIRYSILDKDCPIGIHPFTGQLSTQRTLDRELEATHMFQVKAQEEPSGLESFVKVNIIVQDVNDNKPELNVDEIFVCENDRTNTVIGTLRATDKDDQLASFTFSLASDNSNFSLRDYGNSTADIMVKQGPFNLDDPKDYSLDVRISDGGSPLQASITKLAIKSCRCDARRIPTQCKASARSMGVSVSRPDSHSALHTHHTGKHFKGLPAIVSVKWPSKEAGVLKENKFKSKQNRSFCPDSSQKGREVKAIEATSEAPDTPCFRSFSE
ncbi:hypothetical protein KUCAC02_031522 [Chaenocephalus aceratus]|nr:hypothetical protein KUCAC02_031522 [Chaenocephalus aceratus]